MKKKTNLGDITFYQEIDRKDAAFVPIPGWVGIRTVEILSNAGIHVLYLHQKQALEAVINKENVVISTGTSSGKSLCYQIPLIDMLTSDEDGCALLLFPTKALTQDQFHSLSRMIPEKASEIAVYDGDTPKSLRPKIRNHCRVLFTNPDMLHIGLLPFHPAWARFFSNLRYIILDEAHIYKGVFGSHVANVLRRIRRICAHYRCIPQWILCSATLANGQELAEKLADEHFTSITEDYSGNEVKTVLFLNPPIINSEYNIRAGSITTAAQAAKAMLEESGQILIFCQSRQSVESAVRRLRRCNIDASGYRSGYLARERREIEHGMKTGNMQCVVATNALELGMDIGGLDAVISVGYPGSVSALKQRQGRAGRREQRSFFLLIANQTPTDQYIMNHPDFLKNKPIEPILIDPNNLNILMQHLQCALYEIPFAENEQYGGLSIEETQDILNYFVSLGIARRSGGQCFWLDSSEPQSTVSLRSTDSARIHINEITEAGTTTIGEVDRSSSYWMVHRGAVYYHNGISFLIQELDLDNNIANAVRCEVPYSTEAQKHSHITVENILSREEYEGAELLVAEVSVQWRVTGFQKIDNDTHRILESIPLDLPEETLNTKAAILVLKECIREELQSLNIWNSDKNDYGKQWPEIRRNILERDQYRCQLCHQSFPESQLQVHHIVPYRSFLNKAQANQPDNLMTLCPECHQKIEMNVKVRTGLSGFASAFQQMAALFIQSDPGDICPVTEPESSDFKGRPVIFLHEMVPCGLGLSEAIAENFDDIQHSIESLISSCPCIDGCPGCVGAAGENGAGGKAEALAISQKIGRHIA